MWVLITLKNVVLLLIGAAMITFIEFKFNYQYGNLLDIFWISYISFKNIIEVINLYKNDYHD